MLPSGTLRVNPLVLAIHSIQANYEEDPEREYHVPDTVQALLWACCDPDDFGAPEISPLCEAIRSCDHVAVSLLLRHHANPSRREDGNNAPIFLAIQTSSAETVQLLLQYHPRSREAVPTAEGSLWDRRRTVRRRTAIEAAASCPRCRRVIPDCIAGI